MKSKFEKPANNENYKVLERCTLMRQDHMVIFQYGPHDLFYQINNNGG